MPDEYQESDYDDSLTPEIGDESNQTTEQQYADEETEEIEQEEIKSHGWPQFTL